MSYVQVPPAGAGPKVYSKTGTVGPDTVETQVTHIADPTMITNMLAIDNKGAAAVRFAEGQPVMSGFGSLKTTHERVLGVYENSLDTYDALFSTITALGGASTFAPQQSSQVLSVTGTNGSSVSMMTNRYHYYTPGSSNIYKMSVACGDTGKVGNKRSWGAADQNDGLLFQLNEITMTVMIRTSITGSVVEHSVTQSNWNRDKLDGNGASGLLLDVSKANVYWLDYQFLGAGRVRFGVFGPGGDRIVAHIFENAGSSSLPYMRTGTLPAMMENTNIATTGSTTELRSICIGVYTEGTYEDYAFWRFADIDVNGISVTTNSTLMSLRAVNTVNTKHNTVIIYPETLNVYCDQPVAITFWQATDVTGGTWDALASVAEVNYSGSVSTVGSQRFKTLYFQTGAHSFDLDKFFEKNDEGIQMNSDGTYEIWTITATRLTGATTNCSVNIGYKELW